MTVLTVVGEATMQVLAAEVMTDGDPRRNIISNYVPTDYQRGAAKPNDATNVPYYAQPLSQGVDGTGQIWLHFYGPFRGASTDHFDFYVTTLDETGGSPSGTGESLVRISPSSSSYNARADIYFYDDAGATTSVSLGLGYAGLNEYTYDVMIDFDTEQIKGYRNDVLISSTTFTKPVRTPKTFDHLAVGSPTGGFASDYPLSQIILSTESTVGWKVKTINPNGAGSNSEWTGTYDQIDEMVLDDTDLNTTTVSGTTQTYAYEDISAALQDGKEIYGVIVSTVATAGDASQPLVTNQYYNGTTAYNVGTGLNVEQNNFTKPVSEIVTINPDTGAAWTFDEVNNGEFGFKAE